MVSTSLMVDTSSHPRAQLHRCVERSAYDWEAPAGEARLRLTKPDIEIRHSGNATEP